jgi:glycosyltransferase involved in cell wall biosynthesis
MSTFEFRRRPRIVFVAPFGLRQKTTIWARTLPLARYLAAHGCFVSILIPPWDSKEDAGMLWGDEGVEVINVRLLGGLPSITRRLMDEIDRQRPDIVHIVKPRAYAGIVQWLLWQRRREGRAQGPQIVLDVDDWEQAWSSVAGYNPLIARFLDWQERWGFAHADAITAASAWLIHKAEELAPTTPALYLPNGITPPTQPPYRATFDINRPPTILWFTRFVEVDPEWMGEWWQALRSYRADIHLLVAGAPLQKGRNVAYRTALGRNDDGITWLGYVPQSQLPEIYARSDCAVFPATDTPLNQAKCSVRLATTMLDGIPVVASAVGEQVRYGANGAARLVAADASPRQFAAEVVKLLAKRQEQALMTEQARKWLISRYDWARLGQELLGFYEQMLKM